MTSSNDSHPELPIDPDAPDIGGRYSRLPLHLRPDALGLVALGGFLGALARYGVAVIEPTKAGHWPIGTFGVNIVGAFALGTLIEGLSRRGGDIGWRRRARLLVGTGFCGALTTYSTLAVEADLLVRDHHSVLALLYLVASLFAGLLAVVAGIAAATRQHSRQQRSERDDPSGRRSAA
jgi:CrcB protein